MGDKERLSSLRVFTSVKLTWCAREDLNLQAFKGIATSTLRVYQFHHSRLPRYYSSPVGLDKPL